MDTTLLLALLAFVNASMGLQIHDLPALSIEPPAQIEQLCGPRLACYTLNVVHIRDDVPLDRDSNRSVIVHEIVHHVQEKSGRFGLIDSAERFALREQEAHKIQYKFLND